MSYNTFSPIIYDGLILYLDSYNTKSYDNGLTWNNLIGSDSGILVGGCTFSNNKMIFNGSSGYIDYGSNTIAAQLRGTSTFTINIWIKKTNVNSDFALGAYDANTLTGLFFQWYIDNTIYVGVRNNNKYNSTPLIWTDNWFNLVMVYDGNQILDVDKAIVYVNGELKSMSNNGSLLSSVPADVIDFRIGNTVGYPTFFNGMMSTINIYNRVLSSTEIIYNYNALKNRFIV